MQVRVSRPLVPSSPSTQSLLERKAVSGVNRFPFTSVQMNSVLMQSAG